MNLSERMMNYRAKHGLSQTALSKLLGEAVNIVHRCENPNYNRKMHKAHELRLSLKLAELEEKDNV